jgi:hypothetical protein
MELSVNSIRITRVSSIFFHSEGIEYETMAMVRINQGL